MAYAANDLPEPVRTKVEFSNRNGGSSNDVSYEVVPDDIVRPYGVMAPTIRHYGETAAIEQKIAALALRSETKARDVFDLDLLLRRRARSAPSETLSTPYAADGALRAMEIPYDSFRTEVVPFLDADLATLYDEQTWDRMRADVAASLEEIDNATGDGQ